MIVIHSNIFGALVAFLIGVIIATINYALSRYVLKNHASKYALMQILRQFIQIAYLVIIYVFYGHTPWDLVWLLIGGCMGITLPMIWFTYRLVKLNDSLGGKGESSDG